MSDHQTRSSPQEAVIMASLQATIRQERLDVATGKRFMDFDHGATALRITSQRSSQLGTSAPQWALDKMIMGANEKRVCAYSTVMSGTVLHALHAAFTAENVIEGLGDVTLADALRFCDEHRGVHLDTVRTYLGTIWACGVKGMLGAIVSPSGTGALNLLVVKTGGVCPFAAVPKFISGHIWADRDYYIAWAEPPPPPDDDDDEERKGSGSTMVIWSTTDRGAHRAMHMATLLGSAHTQEAQAAFPLVPFRALLRALALCTGTVTITVLDKGDVRVPSAAASEDVILAAYATDKPQKVAQACGNCRAMATHKCGRCKKVYYCKDVCQRAHWPTHKPQCNEQ